MTTVILFVALSLTSLHASAPQFAYRVSRNYPDNQIYQDYSTATHGELIEAAAKKMVTLDKGSQCSFDNKNIITAGSLKEGEITNSLDSNAAAVPLTLTCRTADSHLPQMITDGDTRTYWLSNGSNPLSKLVIDLKETYQIFYARLIMLTVPEYIVVTKREYQTDEEYVLFVSSPNCSGSLPQGLPRGTPYDCNDWLNVYNGPQNDSVEIQLDLAYKALTSGGHHINQTSFDIALEEGHFKSRYVSIYLYGYAHPSPVHAVNEISIKGQAVDVVRQDERPNTKGVTRGVQPSRTSTFNFPG